MQLELFDVATHYPFELDEQYPTFKSENEIKHDALISDFVGFEKVIEKYL